MFSVLHVICCSRRPIRESPFQRPTTHVAFGCVNDVLRLGVGFDVPCLPRCGQQYSRICYTINCGRYAKLLTKGILLQELGPWNRALECRLSTRGRANSHPEIMLFCRDMYRRLEAPDPHEAGKDDSSFCERSIFSSWGISPNINGTGPDS